MFLSSLPEPLPELCYVASSIIALAAAGLGCCFGPIGLHGPQRGRRIGSIPRESQRLSIPLLCSARAMPGYHVTVYSAHMPVVTDGVAIPGFVYFQSTSEQTAGSYEVYSQRSPARYPVRAATYRGRVDAMRLPLPYRPGHYEVCFYYANFSGTVDCYLWRRGLPPNRYIKYQVPDIHDPRDWFYGTRYVFVGVHTDQPMSRAWRRAGLGRFYSVMRQAV